MRSYRLLVGTAALSLAAFAAFADPLTITTPTTTAVATKTAANNTAGDITVATGGNIIVTTGTAATINSANVLTNGTTISSSASTNGTGVLIDGTTPFGAFTLNQNGIVSVTGTATGATGNIGINFANGPLTGNVTTNATSSITVTGDNAFGVLIGAPFTGNIALRSIGVTGANSSALALTQALSGNLSLIGTSSSTGAGGYGFNIAAPIVGQFNNGGTLNVGGPRTFDGSGNPVAGNVGLAGVRVSANVTGGIVNDLYYVDPTTGVRQPTATTGTGTTAISNTLRTGTITTTGDAPAIWVGPSATSTTPIAIGPVGTGTDGYAIVNRSALTVSVAKAGLDATGIRIGGGGVATTLAGGISSQVTAAIAVSSADASATGIHLLTGANVPTILNEGTLSVASSQSAAVGSTPVGKGGPAYGIVIDQGATLTSLTNSGTISVQGVGNTTSASGTTFAGASGIVDQSGTLGLITNTGTITTLSGGTTTAIDLTASNGAVTVANSGTIRGDIAFGSGPSTLALSGGTINGAVRFGTGRSLLALSGAASFANGFSTPTGVAVDVTLQDTAVLDLSRGPGTINSVNAIGSSVLVVPVSPGGAALIVNGTASFIGSSKVRLALQSLAASQNLSVIQANNGFFTEPNHLPTLIDASSAPYLFTASAPAIVGGTTLTISLARKSAADIGLTGGQASLYDVSVLAFANSPTESAAIANLPSQAAVVSAYRQLTPPSVGRAALRAAQALSDGGFGAAAARLDVIESSRHGGKKGLGLWLQEFGDFNSQRAGTNELGFDESSFGLAGGIDRPFLGLDAVGLAAITNWTTIRQGRTPGNASTPIHIQTQGVEPYASKSIGPLFVQVNGLVAYNRYDSTRQLTFGGLNDTVGARWDGLQYSAGATVGARLSRGRLRFTPSNTISWTQIQENAYAETGGGAFDLGVNKQTDSATTDTAKVKLAYLLKLIDSNLEFEIHAGYVHQFESKATKTDIHFLTLPGDPFTVTGDAIRTEQLSYGGGVGYVQDDFKLKFGYDRRQETGFHDQSLALSAGFSF